LTRRELERESEYASLPRVRHVLHLLLLLLLPESREHAFNAESYIPVDYAHQNLGKRTLYKYSELATRSLKRNMTHFCWKIDRFWRPSAKIYSISVSKHVASRPCHGQVKLTCLPIFLPSFLPACLPAGSQVHKRRLYPTVGCLCSPLCFRVRRRILSYQVCRRGTSGIRSSFPRVGLSAALGTDSALLGELVPCCQMAIRSARSSRLEALGPLGCAPLNELTTQTTVIVSLRKDQFMFLQLPQGRSASKVPATLLHCSRRLASLHT